MFTQSVQLYVFVRPSSGHTAFSDDALNVNSMNVYPGGAQAILHDTIWNAKGWFLAMVRPKECDEFFKKGVSTQKG